jgi:2-iminobutanoate/2-iminopropanoate deaminase
MTIRSLRLLVTLVALLPAGFAATTARGAEYLASEQTVSLGLPFSDAVRTGGLLILSGQLGNLPGSMQLAPGGIKAEARQALENVKRILEANGSSMDRVVKCTVMMADIAEWGAFNEVYVGYFPGHKPARSAFAANGLAANARVELECWAEG